jgi:hypothetical protein
MWILIRIGSGVNVFVDPGPCPDPDRINSDPQKIESIPVRIRIRAESIRIHNPGTEFGKKIKNIKKATR